MTRRLVGLALAALAALSYLAEATPTPAIALRDAASWEGQAVVLHGVARDVRRGDALRFDLVGDGHALPVRLEAAAPPVRDGQTLEVRGRLARLHGTLTLVADRVAADVAVPGLAVSLAALALDPATWQDTAVQVQGTVERGRLRADGHAIALGTGDWPAEGAVQATALLRYEPTCACHLLDRVA